MKDYADKSWLKRKPGPMATPCERTKEIWKYRIKRQAE